MEHQYPLLAELEALLPAASLRPHAVTCVDSCRSLLAEGAIEDADASSISFVTPTGSVRVEIPNGVDDAFLFSLYRQCSSAILNEQRAMLVKAVVANSLARRRTNRIDSAWHLYFQRQMANDSACDEIGILASISTAEELRILTDKVKATALELPPLSKVRVAVIPSAVPVWNAKTGELRLGDKAVHCRNQPRGLVRALLDAFQAKGWPSWIDGKQVADNVKPGAPSSHDDNGRDLRVRDAAATLRKKTAGWIEWHAEADNHLSWEPV